MNYKTKTSIRWKDATFKQKVDSFLYAFGLIIEPFVWLLILAGLGLILFFGRIFRIKRIWVPPNSAE